MNQIRKLMKASKLTNVKVAHDLDVSHVTVSVVVNGHQPSKRIQEYIADKLGKTVEELWPADPPTKTF